MPLNEFLYNRLNLLFRYNGGVRISNSGSVGQKEISSSLLSNRKSLRVVGGEYYRVCCPFCRDRRFRLWVSYLWGFEYDNCTTWHLAICYNEDCLKNQENLDKLRNLVFYAFGGAFHTASAKFVAKLSTEENLIKPPELPKIKKLNELPADHIAVVYLSARGFDINYISEVFGVGFCEDDPRFPAAKGKIIIPFIQEGVYLGWQARPPFEADWKKSQVPKYYTAPGTRKSSILYGFDLAKMFPRCTIVEGVTDVWALGDGAIALLGKVASPEQVSKIRTTWEFVTIMLDGDAKEYSLRLYQNLANVVKNVEIRSLSATEDPAIWCIQNKMRFSIAQK